MKKVLILLTALTLTACNQKPATTPVAIDPEVYEPKDEEVPEEEFEAQDTEVDLNNWAYLDEFGESISDDEIDPEDDYSDDEEESEIRDKMVSTDDNTYLNKDDSTIIFAEESTGQIKAGEDWVLSPGRYKFTIQPSYGMSGIHVYSRKDGTELVSHVLMFDESAGINIREFECEFTEDVLVHATLVDFERIH